MGKHRRYYHNGNWLLIIIGLCLKWVNRVLSLQNRPKKKSSWLQPLFWLRYRKPFPMELLMQGMPIVVLKFILLDRYPDGMTRHASTVLTVNFSILCCLDRFQNCFKIRGSNKISWKAFPPILTHKHSRLVHKLTLQKTKCCELIRKQREAIRAVHKSGTFRPGMASDVLTGSIRQPFEGWLFTFNIQISDNLVGAFFVILSPQSLECLNFPNFAQF